MWKAALRSLFERKLRLALTTLSIVLGVGFVSGTYVLTDSINVAFTDLIDKATGGFDVLVRPTSNFEERERGRIPASVLSQVKAVDGVAGAEGGIEEIAHLVDDQGKPIARNGPPSFATSYGALAEANLFQIRSGRFPRGTAEIGVDAGTAERQGWKVGRKVKAVLHGPVQEFTLTGLVEIQGLDSLGGATMLVFDLESAQTLFARGDTFDSLTVIGEAGVSAGALRSRIDDVLPAQYQVISREAYLGEITEELNRGLGFFTRALLTFGFIALFVGAFQIFNTFSIVFAQRVREFALLRAIGAHRAQILRTVLAEAALIGLGASVLGVFVGYLMAIGMKALIKALGSDLPNSGAPLLPRTIIASIVVGTAVTVISSIVPAIRSTRVPPVAAARERAYVPTKGRGRKLLAVAVVLGLLGLGLLSFGLFGKTDSRVMPTGIGMTAVFLAVSLASPLFARPVAQTLGWPFTKLFGVTGRMARGNATRDPGRTAATAAALMIGVALVSFITTFTSSLRESGQRGLERRLRADFVVIPQMGARISSDVVSGLDALPETEAVMGIRRGDVRIYGQGYELVALDPSKVEDLYSLDLAGGKIGALNNGIFINKDLAKRKGWSVGDDVEVEFPRVPPHKLKVTGVFSNAIADANAVVSIETFERGYFEQRDYRVYVSVAKGVNPKDGRRAIDRVLETYPNLRILDQSDILREQSQNLNQLLNAVNALLGLALTIALFGIINTLALSVIERTREIGLMRAIGVSRSQVRSMLRWEAMIIAVMGAILGIVLGIFFAWLMTRALKDQGLTDFVVPGARLALYIVLAGLAGILAAVGPARRAARIDVLRAIAYE